jgi:hypothetical protein
MNDEVPRFDADASALAPASARRRWKRTTE